MPERSISPTNSPSVRIVQPFGRVSHMTATPETYDIEDAIAASERQRRALRRVIWVGIAVALPAIVFVVGYPLCVRWQLRQHGWHLDNMFGETGFRGRTQAWIEEHFGRVDGTQLQAHFEGEKLLVRDLERLRQFPNITQVIFKLTDVSEPALAALSKLPNVEMLHFHTARLEPKGIHHLANLPKLWQIQMAEMNLEDSTLQNLAKCHQLHALDLLRVSVPDDSLRHLTKLPQLQRLMLKPTSISNSELEHITNCRNLDHLEISFSHVDDEAASLLPRLTQIRTLHLSMCNVSDIGARRIVEGCPSLRILWFGDVPMTDAAVADFAKLPNLGSLTLERIPVTDAGIQSLAGCSTLKSLTVRSSKVTEAGVADLRSRSPNLGIVIE